MSWYNTPLIWELIQYNYLLNDIEISFYCSQNLALYKHFLTLCRLCNHSLNNHLQLMLAFDPRVACCLFVDQVRIKMNQKWCMNKSCMLSNMGIYVYSIIYWQIQAIFRKLHQILFDWERLHATLLSKIEAELFF